MVLRLVVGFVYFLLLLPTVVIVLYSFYPDAYITFPPERLTLHWYRRALQSESLFVRPFLTSLRLAGAATVVATIIGTLATVALVRHQLRFRGFLNGIVMGPLLIPGLVVGFALMLFFSRWGVLGQFWGLVIGHVVITIAFSVRAVGASLTALDESLEDAASSLGSRPVRVFRKVTLPLIAPGILAGAVFAFVISFDELPLTLLLSGPRTVTLPVQIYAYVQQRSDPTVAAVATIMVLVALVAVVILHRLGALKDLH